MSEENIMDEAPVQDEDLDTNTAADAEQEQTPAAPSLGLADLKLMANVIEVVTQRGAVRANEMAPVGIVYNKLMNFLIANGAVQVPVPEENQEEAPVDQGEEGEE